MSEIQSKPLVEILNGLIESAMKHKDNPKVTDKKITDDFIVDLINIKIKAQMRGRGYTNQEIIKMMRLYKR